jgi:hypothetical protein
MPNDRRQGSFAQEYNRNWNLPLSGRNHVDRFWSDART